MLISHLNHSQNSLYNFAITPFKKGLYKLLDYVLILCAHIGNAILMYVKKVLQLFFALQDTQKFEFTFLILGFLVDNP